jgi:hypothetical protein
MDGNNQEGRRINQEVNEVINMMKMYHTQVWKCHIGNPLFCKLKKTVRKGKEKKEKLIYYSTIHLGISV